MALTSKSKRFLVAGVVVATFVAAGALGFRSDGQGPAPTFRTAKVDRGDITAAIAASGTLAAVVTVQVGSQLSGQVSELLVDFNSEVEPGDGLRRVQTGRIQTYLIMAMAGIVLMMIVRIM